MRNEKIKRIPGEVGRKYAIFLQTTLGFTASLLFRDLIRAYMDYYIAVESLPERTVVIVIITFILVLLAYSVSKIWDVKK